MVRKLRKASRLEGREGSTCTISSCIEVTFAAAVKTGSRIVAERWRYSRYVAASKMAARRGANIDQRGPSMGSDKEKERKSPYMDDARGIASGNMRLQNLSTESTSDSTTGDMLGRRSRALSFSVERVRADERELESLVRTL